MVLNTMESVFTVTGNRLHIVLDGGGGGAKFNSEMVLLPELGTASVSVVRL
jgi:hypothetical protein